MKKILKGTIFIGLKIIEIIAFLIFNWAGYNIGIRTIELDLGVAPTIGDKIGAIIIGDIAVLMFLMLSGLIIFGIYFGFSIIIRKNLEWADNLTNKLIKNRGGK